jgi:signal transduction histidine kinase
MEALQSLNLLDTSPEAELETCEVQPLLAESRGVLLTTEVPASFSRVADREKLLRALTNLVSNAVKFSDRGQTVSIVAVRQAQGTFGFEVPDEGPGLPPERLPRLFERFQSWQGGSSLAGTGLGLTLVREIARLHGGTVQVENLVPRGPVSP